MFIKSFFLKLPPKYERLARGIYLFLQECISFPYLIIKYGTTDIFHDVNIETTTYCNRRCRYCPNSIYDRGTREKEQLMQVETFKRIIDQLAEMHYGDRISPHFYGEPLADRRLPELLSYVKEKLPRAYVVIYSSGDLLSKEMVNRLFEVGVKDYVITLHGEMPEKRRKEHIIASIREMSKSRAMGISIKIQNYEDDTPLSTRAGLVKVSERRGQLLCRLPLSFLLVINYKGDVLLCCNDYHGEAVMGNVNEKTIQEIWSEPNFKKIRAGLRRGRYVLPICKRCIEAELAK